MRMGTHGGTGGLKFGMYMVIFYCITVWNYKE